MARAPRARSGDGLVLHERAGRTSSTRSSGVEEFILEDGDVLLGAP
jgi:hypothetical protein